MPSFSERHGLRPKDAEITIRYDAPSWLRSFVVTQAYKAKVSAQQLRSWLCDILIEAPDLNNWTHPNVDQEVHGLLDSAEWFVTYDLIERIYEQTGSPGSEAYDVAANSAAELFQSNINRAFLQKGVGWQLTDGKIEIRGSETFESGIRTAIALSVTDDRQTAHNELKEALQDLSRRPNPEITGAIQHGMAALECIARATTGETNLTLGEWMKKNRAMFPSPIDVVAEKLWGYTSEFGRHLKEGKSPSVEEAELVIGLIGALAVYLMRRKTEG
jgi:hypothetical protein